VNGLFLLFVDIGLQLSVSQLKTSSPSL